jgi:hypothetical protein
VKKKDQKMQYKNILLAAFNRKSALALNILDALKKLSDKDVVIITARSTGTETEQRLPLRYVFGLRYDF